MKSIKFWNANFFRASGQTLKRGLAWASLRLGASWQWLKQRTTGYCLWLRRCLILGGLLLILGVLLTDWWISHETRDRLYDDVQQVPPKAVALLLGTSSRTRDGRPNLFFRYRVRAAAWLYQAGKVKHIIASGDNHTRYYDEPTAMKKALMAEGVPEQAITLDYAGFRTLDSVVRCKEIFSQEDIIIVSQAFHNQRALFISDFYGIQAVGFNAADVPPAIAIKTRLREYLARFKAVLDLYVLGTQPRFLGEKVEIPV